MMSAFGNSPEKHMPNKLPCLTRVPPAMPPLPPPIANWIRVGQGLPSRVRIPQDCVHVGGKHECGKECTFTIRLGSARLRGPRQSCLAMPRARSHARIKSRGLSSRLVSRRPRDGLHVPSKGRPPRSAARRPSRSGVPHKCSIRPSRTGTD